MALITSLPEELLSIVFNKLKDVNSLAKCRLVCKAWSGPAERAMFSTVSITPNAAKMRSLYAVLKKNPEKAYLIKHLDFNDTYPFPEDRLLDLLPIALTSNIESITGFVSEYDFINTLTDIIERSPNKLDRLKTLTLSSFNSRPPLRLALHCKNTLQTFHLDFTAVYSRIDWTFVNKLNEFINLTSLKLIAKIGTITNLDRILSKCSQLQKLSLAITSWGEKRS